MLLPFRLIYREMREFAKKIIASKKKYKGCVRVSYLHSMV